jgi:hypothetical protein
MFTVDKDRNPAISDKYVTYRTLRFGGAVRGQLVDIGGSADAICRALNESLIAQTITPADILAL